MTILQAILLGIVQGVTEFLPVSSSGHLIIFPELFGWEQQGAAFDVIIHLATLSAVIWVLWGDIVGLFKQITKKGAWRESQLLKLIVATLPVVIVGLIISTAYLESVRTVRVVAINLAIWGAILWAADWYSVKVTAQTKKFQKIGWFQAIVIGLAQVIALMPGSSRSGVTITAGLFSGLDRTTAAKFSFLLAIPAIAGAGLLISIDAVQNGFDTPIPALIAGFISAFISGALSIRFLFKLLIKSNYRWFAVYRIGLGLFLLVLTM
ncbi:undecaprenyl-diphosphatase UppP [Patescibacteria group bacterium]|nr:undecaprenyl-diphosphatase UppP [Patescibacteria group bacterium]